MIRSLKRNQRKVWLIDRKIEASHATFRVGICGSGVRWGVPCWMGCGHQTNSFPFRRWRSIQFSSFASLWNSCSASVTERKPAFYIPPPTRYWRSWRKSIWPRARHCYSFSIGPNKKGMPEPATGRPKATAFADAREYLASCAEPQPRWTLILLEINLPDRWTSWTHIIYCESSSPQMELEPVKPLQAEKPIAF